LTEHGFKATLTQFGEHHHQGGATQVHDVEENYADNEFKETYLGERVHVDEATREERDLVS